jgi:hypothetical protein
VYGSDMHIAEVYMASHFRPFSFFSKCVVTSKEGNRQVGAQALTCRVVGKKEKK